MWVLFVLWVGQDVEEKEKSKLIKKKNINTLLILNYSLLLLFLIDMCLLEVVPLVVL